MSVCVWIWLKLHFALEIDGNTSVDLHGECEDLVPWQEAAYV